MNNATLIAERDSLRAAFIRYIALDQFIGCGCNPDDFDAHFRTLSSSIEDVVFDVLNECETFQTEAE